LEPGRAGTGPGPAVADRLLERRAQQVVDVVAVEGVGEGFVGAVDVQPVVDHRRLEVEDRQAGVVGHALADGRVVDRQQRRLEAGPTPQRGGHRVEQRHLDGQVAGGFGGHQQRLAGHRQGRGVDQLLQVVRGLAHGLAGADHVAAAQLDEAVGLGDLDRRRIKLLAQLQPIAVGHGALQQPGLDA